MPGLWRNQPGTPEGKYLVTRRDGSVPAWPLIVLGARDAAAEVALRAYADSAEALGFEAAYVADVRRLADEFAQYRAEHGASNPTDPPERPDDPEVVVRMRSGRSA
jgi:hypothetical protein